MSSPLTRIHHGRTRQIQPQVLVWRKRMAQYRTLKAKLMELLLCKMDTTQAAAWLKAPSPALNGKSPKQLLNPTHIRRLYDHAKRELRSF